MTCLVVVGTIRSIRKQREAEARCKAMMKLDQDQLEYIKNSLIPNDSQSIHFIFSHSTFLEFNCGGIYGLYE